MSSIEVGTAFVRILPDMTAFNAALTTQVNAATSGAGAASANTKVAASATAAAASTRALAGEQTVSAAAAARIAAAELAVARANIAAATATETLNAAIAKNVGAMEIQTLTQKAAIASQAANVAQLRLSSALAGTPGGAATGNVARNASIAQGSLIGLTRVTGISALGLTVYSAAAVAAGLALRSMVSSAADFQSQLNTFQAVTKSTDIQMKQVSDTAIALGADLSLPSTSANDAAIALTELSKAGLTVEDSLAAARGVLQLSAIANISAGEAAVISATQLNAFGLAGDQATRVTELLADASIAAQGEITDFAAGFAQAGTAAKQSGVSIEDTTALLTQLGLAGIKGADGGTSLRTFLLRLVPTTKEASRYTKALGIELDKNKSIGAQLPDVIEQYRTQLEKLNPQQQTLVLNQIFGQDAFRAASVIFSQQKDALRALTDEFKKTNSAEDLAEAKAKGLSGAVGGLKSQIETAGTAIGLLAAGPLEDMIRGLSDTFTGVEKVVTKFLELQQVQDITKVVKFQFKVLDTVLGPTGLSLKQLLFLLNPVTFPLVGLSALGDGDKTDQGFGTQGPFEIGSSPGASGAGVTAGEAIARGVDEDQQAAAKAVSAAAAASKLDPKLQAAVDAANKSAAETVAKSGVLIPVALNQAVVDAQIKDNLQAELAADNKIVAYLRKRLDMVKGRVKRLAVSQQLESALSARDSVQAEITGNSAAAVAERKAAAAERKRRSDEAIAFDKEAAAAAVANAKASIDLQNSRLDARLAAAQGTKTKVDDKAVYNAMIAFNQAQIRTLRHEEEGLKKTSLAYKQKETAVQGLIRANANLRQSIKGLTDTSATGGGFSLSDLFKEALSQFQEFGSNVSANPMSPGQARGAFAGNLVSAITGSKQDRARLGLDRVADNTNSMDVTLKNIERLLRGEPVPKAASLPQARLAPGVWTADTARRLRNAV